MVALVLHHHRDLAVELARDAVGWLTQRGHEVRLPEVDAGLIERTDLAVPEATVGIGADLAISIGGDGTMLRTVALVSDFDVPVVGLNAGQLGYLAQIDPHGLRMALKRFLAGSYTLEHRMRISAVVLRQGRTVDLGAGLNEVVIEKAESGHTVRLNVFLDREWFTSYVTDGLIVATPTGSTAYAFSARGPIVDPTHRAIQLTPVAPHMLFDRTLVLEPSAEVRVNLAGHRPAKVSVDGREGEAIDPGDTVLCRQAERPALLVRFGPSEFHRIVKEKFGLADR